MVRRAAAAGRLVQPGRRNSTPPPQAPPQQGQGWGPYGGQQHAGQYGSPYGGQYGGQYGYPGGPGQWGKPPAAKPGVIPLRPLDMGEILDGAVATMRAHWRSVLPITLVVATVVQVMSVLLQKYVMSDLALAADPAADIEQTINTLGTASAVSFGAVFIQALGGIVATAMLTMIFSRAVLGNTSTVSAAWREARPQLLRLFGLTLLMGFGFALLVVVLIVPGILARSVGLAVLGGFAALPLAIWLWTKYSLASPALMLEKGTVFKSLGRSSKLVKGAWWRIFGITLLTSIITGIIAAIIVWPLTFLGVALFGGGMGGLQALHGLHRLGSAHPLRHRRDHRADHRDAHAVGRHRPPLRGPAHPPRGARPGARPGRRRRELRHDRRLTHR